MEKTAYVMQIVWVDHLGCERCFMAHSMKAAIRRIEDLVGQGVRWTAISRKGGVPGIS